MDKILADDTIEKAIIGTALLNNTCFIKILHLDPEDFYYDDNRIIFKALLEISKRNLMADVTILYQVLTEQNNENKVKMSLVDIQRMGTVYNFDAHVEKVLDYSRKRKLLAVIEKEKIAIKQNATTIDEVTNELETELQEVNRNRFCESETVDKIVRNISLSGEKYCKTGIAELDEILLGLFGGQLIVIGSRPGIGKSAIVLQIAKNISKSIPIVLFSLEMPKKQIVRRMITTETGINSNKIRAGEISKEDGERIGEAMHNIALNYANLIIVDNENKFWNIANNIKRFYYTHKVGAVIIDYLQLCQMKSQEKRYLQLGEMTSTLKSLSVKLGIPIVILSQLSRTSENNTPQLSDLRESGNIEQDADVVIFLHRKDYKENKTELIVAKNRDSEVGYRKVHFNFQRVRFESYEDELYNVTKEDLL